MGYYSVHQKGQLVRAKSNKMIWIRQGALDGVINRNEQMQLVTAYAFAELNGLRADKKYNSQDVCE